MSTSNLIPYTPSQRFLQQLSESGLSLDKTAMQSARNREAERLLPPGRSSPVKSGLFAFLQVALFFWIAAFVETVSAAELVIQMPELDFTHDPMSWVLSLQVLFFVGFFLVCVALLREIRHARSNQAMSVSGKALNSGSGGEEGCQAMVEKSRGATEKIEILPKREVSGNARLVMGGATRTGQFREENQDAFITQRLGFDAGLMVVCDGVGGHPGGAEAARYGAFYVRRFLSKYFASRPVSSDVLRASLLLTQKLFVLKEIEGLTTVIVAVIDGDWLYYATLGDGALSLIHADGMVQELLTPHHALGEADNIITAYLCASKVFEPRVGAVAWEPGSMLLAMSDGASDLLPMDQLVEHRSAYQRHLQHSGVDGFCDHLLQTIEMARDIKSGALLHSDNMTLAMAASLVDADSNMSYGPAESDDCVEEGSADGTQ